ncbi:MAG: hypothetical protein ABSA83_20390 [Verrucomicrobiota bacterium]
MGSFAAFDTIGGHEEIRKTRLFTNRLGYGQKGHRGKIALDRSAKGNDARFGIGSASKETIQKTAQGKIVPQIPIKRWSLMLVV